MSWAIHLEKTTDRVIRIEVKSLADIPAEADEALERSDKHKFRWFPRSLGQGDLLQQKLSLRGPIGKRASDDQRPLLCPEQLQNSLLIAGQRVDVDDVRVGVQVGGELPRQHFGHVSERNERQAAPVHGQERIDTLARLFLR